MSSLFTWRQSSIGLEDAILKCAPALGTPAFALLYSPSECMLARIAGADLFTLAKKKGAPDGQPAETEYEEQTVDLEPVYEARLFGPNAELRWLRTGETGDAALLSEDEAPPHCRLADRMGAKPAEVEIIPGQYLLWGRGVEAQPKKMPEGWSRIATARIGKLDVPVAGVAKDDRVVLRVNEYAQTVDEHGNVTIIDERLCGLERRSQNEVRLDGKETHCA